MGPHHDPGTTFKTGRIGTTVINVVHIYWPAAASLLSSVLLRPALQACLGAVLQELLP